jgi:hypothetical protein
MKKIILIILIILLSTSTVYAEIMYLTDQSWSYEEKSLIPDDALFIYGEDEKVNVIDSKLVMKPKWVSALNTYMNIDEHHKVYLVENNGKIGYLPEFVLTTKKPKYSYTVKSCNKELLLSADTYIYEKPYKKSTKIKLNKQISFATIGQTNKWYQIYYKGSAYFIRKDSSNILSINPVNYPTIILDGVNNKCKIRFTYYYNMIPKETRDKLNDFTFVISDWENINGEYISMLQDIDSISGFTIHTDKVIYLREDDRTTLEFSLFHEIGHVLYRTNKSFTYDPKEIKNLKLYTYYTTPKEYCAEGFDLYMRQYDMLQEFAPKLFEYYDGVVNW